MSFCYDIAVFEGISDMGYPRKDVDGDYCCERVSVGEVVTDPMSREGDCEAVGSSELNGDEVGELSCFVNCAGVGILRKYQERVEVGESVHVGW